MAKRLQRYSHRAAEYDRPTQKWVCGHSVDGRCCPQGPGRRGECRGTGECLPAREGDRWVCTRGEACGGSCAAGPGPDGKCGSPLSPCQPVRSLRSLRKSAVVAVVILTAALLVVVLAGDRKSVAINPGRLASVHSGIAADCARCHEEGAALSLFARPGRDNPHFIADRAMANSALCLECHAGEIGDWESSARFAHGWKEEEREEKLADARARRESSGRGGDRDAGKDGSWLVWLASKGGAREKSLAGDLACAVCHQEHHGLRASLTEMSNAQCQVCHRETFSSFEEGHPAFASVRYPYSRRTRIHFDHESHYANHFGDDRESYPGDADPAWPPGDGGQSCRMCHEPDEEGRFMKVKSYAAACARCHEETTVRGGQELTFLEFPGLAPGEENGDVPSMAGLWPVAREGEAILSPTMRLLLSPETRDALRAHEAKTATAAKDAGAAEGDADPGEEAAVRMTVARDLQRLFRDAWESDEGSARLVERIHEGGFADEELAGRMLAGLPVDTVFRQLFPGSPVRLADVDLPRLDLATLERHLAKKGRSLGLWPRGGTPALTPVMGEMLRAREGESDFPAGVMDSLLDERGEGGVFRAADGSVDLSDLAGATDEEIAAVEKVAWQLKEFFVTTGGKGGPFLRPWARHQGGILDQGGAAPELAKVFFWAKRDEDFRRGVGAELSRAREGGYPGPATATEASEAPTGKQQTSAADADFGAAPAEDADFGVAPADDADFGAAPAAEEVKAGKAPEKDGDFGAAPARDAGFGAVPADDADFGASPAADADFGGGKSSEEPAPPEEEASAGADLSTTPHKSARAKQWQHSGGWWQHGGAIHYRTQGHADPVIMAWIEAAVAACNAEDPVVRASGEEILLTTFQWEKGVDSMASGRCLKCHTVDRDAESGRFRINWHPAHGVAGLSNRPAGLTRYSHEKHIIAMDCLNCHLPKDAGGYPAAFPVEVALPAASASANSEAVAKLDPDLTFHPNFQPMVKEQCATCHRKNAAGNDCLQCHFYHARGHAEDADAAGGR